MATMCPYCNIEVSESQIEAEDGCCPECGSAIAVPSFLDEEELEDEFDEETDGAYDDLDDDDEFLDGEDLDDMFGDEDLDAEFDDDFEDDEKY